MKFRIVATTTYHKGQNKLYWSVEYRKNIFDFWHSLVLANTKSDALSYIESEKKRLNS